MYFLSGTGNVNHQEMRLIPTSQTNKGVCHNVALPFTLKLLSQTKRRIMETEIFHHAKIQSSKNLLKETKIFQDIIIL
jgi:hypothetical protein